MISHPIPPVFDERSEILILGSFPSVKSREYGFFYGHPSNRFWKVLKEVLAWSAEPVDTEEKKKLLLESHVALWDVIASCDVTGSSDASIRNAVPNDLLPILKAGRIRTIFCNGSTAYSLYMKTIYPSLGILPVRLPSTSPANASFRLEELTNEWREALRQALPVIPEKEAEDEY
ncbi:MAG: DNA-deoxyinosine glycosylase [Clostridia bacterium]|nr:DNA-deoxyinosine glycosylase [Clostridia bacterium]